MFILFAGEGGDERGWDAIISWGDDVLELLQEHREGAYVWGEIIRIDADSCSRILTYVPDLKLWDFI